MTHSRDAAQAIASFSRVIDANPKDDDAWEWRSLARMAEKDWEGALGDIAKAIELRPGHAPYLKTQSRIREKAGK